MPTSPLDPEPEVVRVRVPAKINLALLVGALEEDDHHPLLTVFQAVSLFDDVVAAPGPPGSVTITMTGQTDGVGPEADNLAVRAARLLAQEHGDPDRLGARLTVRKNIPVAGGMAGGSADAAGALLACSVLWDLDVAPDELAELGSQLGADVPFALLGGTALGTGRGDVLAPVLSRGCLHWVLALVTGGLSTAAVYRRFDELRPEGGTRPLEVPDGLMAALRSGDARALGSMLHNDLAEAALDLRPDLAETLARGRAAGAEAALVSGSGPTCAFLCLDESAAIDLSTQLSLAPGLSGVRRVRSAVHGARLLT